MITNLFIVIVDMVARLEIAPPEMIRFSDIDWNHHQQLKPRQHCLNHHSGCTHLRRATSFPAESDGFNSAPVRFRSSNIVRTTAGHWIQPVFVEIIQKDSDSKKKIP